MLSRISSIIALLAMGLLTGCGGGSAPAPTATPGPVAPPSAPPVAPPGPTAAAPAAQPAVSDVYALVPDSATGALVIRAPKLLASPFAQSEAVKKLADDIRSKNGVEIGQLDEVIIVFTGTGTSGGYTPSSPYGGERRETGPPPAAYGPPSSPYGPNVGSGAGANAASQQAAMAMLGPMAPTADSMIVILRATAPFDRAKMIELEKVEETETESGQFKFHRAKEATNPSISFFDDRTLLIGRETTLQGFFTAAASPSAPAYGPPTDGEETAAAPAGSKLGEKLRTAPLELALYGTMKFGGLQLGALPPGTQTPPGMDPSTMMSTMAATVPGGAFSLDLTSGAKLVLDLEAANAEAAQQLWVNLQSAQGTINAMIGLQKAVSPPNQTPQEKELREKGFAVWDQFSKTMKVEKGGDANLHVLVSGSLDQPMVDSLAAMMKRDLFVPPGSPQAMALVEAQMKQIGLAAHTYLSEKTKLPTAAIMSADGKPLLSWRVALLPYLGQKELFDQFKLDEPWDSEHNKALVEKMPAVYSIPGVNEPGKTTLLAPISDKTVFGNQEGATLVMASDGASNTILLVQANADKAVTWTAPDDLKFDAAKPTAGLDKAYPGVFLALWLDGAVHSIALDTAKATTAGLFTYAGAEPVDLSALIAAAATAATRPAETNGGEATAASGAGEEAYEEGWAGDAKRAVNRGHDKEAARLALAAALIAEDDVLAKDVMHFTKMQTKMPVHFLRFGLGAMPDPKRRKETNTTGGSAGDFGRTPGSTSGDDDEETDPQKQFDDLAGEVGQEMIKELRDMLDDGDFGELFAYERQKSADGSGTPQPEGMRFETGRNPYGPSGPSSGSATAPGTPDEVAERAPRGLTILGSGDRKKLQDAAVEAEVDMLLIAEITTKNNRSTDPAVQFTLTEVATKKKFAQSEPIPLPNNGSSSAFGGTGSTASGANNDADTRKKNMAKWLSTMKSTLKFEEVPNLPADKVLTRATKAVGTGKQKYPLPLLLELRFYQALGALKPEDALPLVQKVVGDEAKAKTLVEGTPEERKAVLEEYILPPPDEKGATIDSDS